MGPREMGLWSVITEFEVSVGEFRTHDEEGSRMGALESVALPPEGPLLKQEKSQH